MHTVSKSYNICIFYRNSWTFPNRYVFLFERIWVGATLHCRRCFSIVALSSFSTRRQWHVNGIEFETCWCHFLSWCHLLGWCFFQHVSIFEAFLWKIHPVKTGSPSLGNSTWQVVLDVGCNSGALQKSHRKGKLGKSSTKKVPFKRGICYVTGRLCVWYYLDVFVW